MLPVPPSPHFLIFLLLPITYHLRMCDSQKHDGLSDTAMQDNGISREEIAIN